MTDDNLSPVPTDYDFMQRALELAEEGGALGEVPIGAVLVYDNKIIAEAYNTNRMEHNPVFHAEINVITRGCRYFNNERLTGTRLYVTKEPCTMCAGAIIHSRIEEVIVAARDEKYGACGTVFDICGNSTYNHVPLIRFGILEEESSRVLKNFFKKLRQ